MVILDKAAELFRRFMGRGKKQIVVPPTPAMVTTTVPTECSPKKRTRSEIAEGRRNARGCSGHQKFPKDYWAGRPLTPAEMREKYPNEYRSHREKMSVLRAEKKDQKQTAAAVAVQPSAQPAEGVA